MTWTDSAGTLQLDTGTTDDLANATSISYVTALDTDHKCYLVDGDISLTANSTWKEINSIVIVHIGGQFTNGSWAATATMEFGDGDLTDEDKPILQNGCWFLHDQEANAGSAAQYVMLNSSTVAESGNLNWYGGCFESWPCNNTAAGGGGFWCMKDDTVNVIGVNFTRFGGGRFFGTDFRIQEVKMMGSGRLGLSVLGTTDPVGIRDLILMDSVMGYYFSSFQNADTTFTNTATRNAPIESNSLGNAAEIIDSDQVTTFFDDIVTTGGEVIEEKTSYNLTVTAGGAQTLAAGSPSAGDALDDCEVRLVRTETRANDATGWSDSFLEIFTANTDVNGQIAQQLLVRTTFRNGDTLPTDRDGYQGFFSIQRQYGFQFEHKPVFPQFGAARGFVEDSVLKVNTFVATAEATVAALSGIAMDEVNQEIDITSAHTVQEIYDWLQWNCAQPAQMNFRAEDLDNTDAQWKGEGPVSPLNTSDGTLFTVHTNWTITGIGDVTLDGKILELANGDRYVTVSINGMQDQARWDVRLESNNSVVYSGVADTTGAFSVRRLWEQTDVDVIVRVSLQGFVFFEVLGTIGNAGLTIDANIRREPNYKVGKGFFQQRHFRWRDDDGSEAAATWAQGEDVNDTGLAVGVNTRLRIQIDETTARPKRAQPRLQFREVGADAWIDVDDA